MKLFIIFVYFVYSYAAPSCFPVKLFRISHDESRFRLWIKLSIGTRSMLLEGLDSDSLVRRF